MEMDMANAPTLSEAKRMKTAELQKRLRDHSVSETRFSISICLLAHKLFVKFVEMYSAVCVGLVVFLWP